MSHHCSRVFIWCIVGLFLFSFILSGCNGGQDSGLIDGDTELSGEDQIENDVEETTDGDSEQADIEDTESDVENDFSEGDSEDAENTDAENSEIDGDFDDDYSENEPDEEYEEEIERITLDLIEGCNPFATSDECALPLPSSFYEIEDTNSPTGVRGNFPEDLVSNSSGTTHFDISYANLADGCSPATPILLHFAADIDPEYLITIENIEDSISDESPVALFNLETGKRVMFMSEMDMNRLNESLYPKHFAMIIRPMEPMEMGDRHVVVINNGIKDVEGNIIESPAAFAALRDAIYTTNEIIEDKREHYEEIFTFLEENGYQRSNIMLAWDFMVASDDWLLGSVISMRNKALEAYKTEDLSYTIESISENPDSNLRMQVQGTFEVPNFLIPDDGENENHNTFDYDENHHPRRQAENQTFPFTMLIPKSAVDSEEPLPLLIFGHGIFGSAKQYLSWSVLHKLANDNKLVILGTDWIGLSYSDADLLKTEILSNVNRIALITDRLQQSLVNNVVLTEFGVGKLGEDESLQVATNALIDKNRVYYYGVSLGGIMGSSFVSISNRIDRAVFAVPGSVWSNMLPRSSVWNEFKDLFDLLYMNPLTQQMMIMFIQDRFDNSDPINLSELMFDSPLEDAPQNRQILIQESMEDCLVPNMSTETLARALGVKLMTPNQSEPFGIQTTDAPSEESVMVQYYLANQIANYVPPKENVPPEKDNRTHDKVATLPDVISQIKYFLDNGEIKWFCDDVCTCEGVCTF